MVDELRQAFELAQQRPDEVQRRIAELLRLARATPSANQTRQWWSRVPDLPQGRERWIVVRGAEGEARARATCQRQAKRDRASWEKRLWHLGNQTFACRADAEAALAKACQRQPAWLQVQSTVLAVPKYAKRGCPRSACSSISWPKDACVSA